MSKISDGGWGSNFHNLRFGSLMNMNLSENHFIIFLLEFKNGLYYTESSSFARWFQHYEAMGGTYVKFDQLGSGLYLEAVRKTYRKNPIDVSLFTLIFQPWID